MSQEKGSSNHEFPIKQAGYLLGALTVLTAHLIAGELNQADAEKAQARGPVEPLSFEVGSHAHNAGDGISDNTFPDVQEALETATYVEVDVRFVPELGTYVLSHDRPENPENFLEEDSSRLLLSEYLKMIAETNEIRGEDEKVVALIELKGTQSPEEIKALFDIIQGVDEQFEQDLTSKIILYKSMRLAGELRQFDPIFQEKLRRGLTTDQVRLIPMFEVIPSLSVIQRVAAMGDGKEFDGIAGGMSATAKIDPNLTKLRQFIRRANAVGLQVFMGTPQTPEQLKKMIDEGVFTANTDDIKMYNGLIIIQVRPAEITDPSKFSVEERLNADEEFRKKWNRRDSTFKDSRDLRKIQQSKSNQRPVNPRNGRR